MEIKTTEEIHRDYELDYYGEEYQADIQWVNKKDLLEFLNYYFRKLTKDGQKRKSEVVENIIDKVLIERR